MDSHEVRRAWAERSGEFSPEYYAYYGPNEASAALLDVFDDTVGSGAAVLELGCSAGRHLAHLHDRGYDDLTGIDLNPDAFDVLAEEYPALDEAGTFHVAAIEEFVADLPDDAFDAVYSVETLQHVHPGDAWVFEDLLRVAGDLLVTVENEGGANGGGDEDGVDEARVDGDGDGDGGDDPDAETRPDGETDAGDSAAVNYVDDGLPLYYRDWRGVFTDLGATELRSRSMDRDTLRAFRPPRN